MRNRGEIRMADLDPRRGTEPGKTRPVLIVQSQALLDANRPSTLIVPLTTNRRLIQGPVTRLPDPLMAKVGEAIREVLDLAEP